MSRGYPGFRRCMWMLRRRDPQVQEEGFHLLRPRAGEHVHELISEFRAGQDRGLRCRLLELIGEAHSPAAFDLLIESLRCDDLDLKLWAIRGLEQLGTKAARSALWEAQAESLPAPEDTALFRRELRAALARIRDT